MKFLVWHASSTSSRNLLLQAWQPVNRTDLHSFHSHLIQSVLRRMGKVVKRGRWKARKSDFGDGVQWVVVEEKRSRPAKQGRLFLRNCHPKWVSEFIARLFFNTHQQFELCGGGGQEEDQIHQNSRMARRESLFIAAIR